jgi:hypothetical protein
MLPAVGEVVTVRYTGRGASGDRQQAVVRHVGSLQTGRGRSRGSGSRWCPTPPASPTSTAREGARYPCPEACAAFAAASCPWFFGETLHFRIVQVGAGGMTLKSTQHHPPLPPRAALDFELHLASVAPRAAVAADVGAARRGGRRPRGRRRVGRPPARAAERALALSAGRRRDS